MTTLITGGLGFIGAHTVRAFAEAGERVVATFYESHLVPTFLAPFVGDTVVLEQCDVGAPGARSRLLRRSTASTASCSWPSTGVRPPTLEKTSV